MVVFGDFVRLKGIGGAVSSGKKCRKRGRVPPKQNEDGNVYTIDLSEVDSVYQLHRHRKSVAIWAHRWQDYLPRVDQNNTRH